MCVREKVCVREKNREKVFSVFFIFALAVETEKWYIFKSLTEKESSEVRRRVRNRSLKAGNRLE